MSVDPCARRPQTAARSDDGTIGVLSLGLAIVMILVVLVVAAASQVHLQHMRLAHLADELSLDAADALDLDEYYAGEAPLPTDDAAVDLAQARMETAVGQHVSDAAGRVRLDGVRVVDVSTPDGATAVVTVEVTVYPLFGIEPLLPFADGIVLSTTSSARTF